MALRPLTTFSLLVYALAFATAAGHTAERPAIESVSLLAGGGVRRVIIALSADAAYRVSTAPAGAVNRPPSQIRIDFAPARLGVTAPALLRFSDPVVKEVRTEHVSPSTVRVSLAVQNVGTYTVSAARSPAQVVILLRPAQVPSPAIRDTVDKSPLPPLLQRGEVRSAGGFSPPPATKEDFPRIVTKEGESTAAQSRPRIMIDPGHGGHDPGATGHGGLQEKTLVLAVSKRLGRKLEARLPVDVLYTRTRDVYISLPDRTARANLAKADVFISVHANASPNPIAQGIETYYLNNTNDQATLRLAGIENGIRQRNGLRQRGTDLSLILSDLIQTGKEEESVVLANALQRALVRHARQGYRGARDLGVKKGPFYVLVGAHMPCVLVELAFLSHLVEGRNLQETAYQEALAEGLFQGIARFLGANVMAKDL